MTRDRFGVAALVAGSSSRTVHDMDDAEHHCRVFLQVWAEAVVSQVRRLRHTRAGAAKRGRAYERIGGASTNWTCRRTSARCG